MKRTDMNLDELRRERVKYMTKLNLLWKGFHELSAKDLADDFTFSCTRKIAKSINTGIKSISKLIIKKETKEFLERMLVENEEVLKNTLK